MEVKTQDNKIFAPLKNKWLMLQPEEEVRQKYICRLVDSYGYSLEQMDQERKVTNSQRGHGAARADIVIWKSKQDKIEGKAAFIVIECKAECVTIRKEDYYQGYNYASWAGADFFVTTNIKETHSGSHFGLGLYFGCSCWNSYLDLCVMNDCINEIEIQQTSSTLDFILCDYFDKRDIPPSKDKRSILAYASKHKILTTGTAAVPTFTRYSPHLSPWTISHNSLISKSPYP